MDTIIAWTTQITVLPEAGSPEMLGKETRWLWSNSFHPLLTSPLETGEPSRIKLLPWIVAQPFTPLARAERGCTPAINNQRRYYWVRKPPASSPSVLTNSWADVQLGDETMRSIYEAEESHPGNPFCQESSRAACASYEKPTRSPGAMKRFIQALLAVRLSPSITTYMMPLFPLYQAKFGGKSLHEMHQKTLFPS